MPGRGEEEAVSQKLHAIVSLASLLGQADLRPEGAL